MCGEMRRMGYWHFSAGTLRDGSPLPRAGEYTPYVYDIDPCARGWHMSARAIDALRYAPGPYVARVEPLGHVMEHGDPVDKVVAYARRTITDYLDATDTLQAFARSCALDVIDLWDAPPVVRQYLETGDQSLRHAAWTTAWTADWAAGEAVWAAARAAALNAAGDAAWHAAGNAAKDARAARAARAAAGAAAGDAAVDAAWATGEAARADLTAARAAWATGETARADQTAAREAQNVRLTSMLEDRIDGRQ